MDRKEWCLLIVVFVLTFDVEAMTRQQLKNSGKLLKKSCMPKNDVTEGRRVTGTTFKEAKGEDLYQVGGIEQGKFIEDRNVMCYIACIYTMSQAVKNNKILHEGMIKQVDMMFPPEIKDAVKASIEKCKGVAKNYKDICEASYWTTKCMYDADPSTFVFP